MRGDRPAAEVGNINTPTPTHKDDEVWGAVVAAKSFLEFLEDLMSVRHDRPVHLRGEARRHFSTASLEASLKVKACGVCAHFRHAEGDFEDSPALHIVFGLRAGCVSPRSP